MAGEEKEIRMKIAIFEDNYKHMEEAEEMAKELGIEVETRYEVDSLDRMWGIFEYDKEKKDYVAEVDGIISDIYLPARYSGGLPSTSADYPCGLIIAAQAFRRGIPFVFCTSGYHHGTKYQWVNEIIRAMGWPEMVDDLTVGNGDAKHKNWKRAFEAVIKFIKEKRGD